MYETNIYYLNSKETQTKGTKWNYLKLHIDSNHPDHHEKKHVCTICGKSFIFAESCKLHESKHEKFPCHLCEKVLTEKYTLRDHLAMIHNYEASQVICEICGFSAVTKKKIQRHMREKHITKYQQKCPYCEFQSAQMNKMHIHIDSKHSHHDEKTFFCDHCSRSFIFLASLKKHLANLKTMERERAKKGITAKKLSV